jgi:hypothetical protein
MTLLSRQATVRVARIGDKNGCHKVGSKSADLQANGTDEVKRVWTRLDGASS